jgi:hypothetical protein|tara:strand:+ start:227 stop:688 length:462 start_codon:yes stop_codon:yes gene_type:complete
MKKEELIRVIDKIVERKVQQQITKLKEEIFIDKEKPLSVESIQEEFVRKPKVKKKKIHYTKNESLNKILNETKGGIQGGHEPYPTMGGGTFDTSRMADMLGYGGSDEKKREVGAVQTMQKAGVNVDQVPDHVTSALTKDYSKLMKAIDKKKGK